MNLDLNEFIMEVLQDKFNNTLKVSYNGINNKRIECRFLSTESDITVGLEVCENNLFDNTPDDTLVTAEVFYQTLTTGKFPNWDETLSIIRGLRR